MLARENRMVDAQIMRGMMRSVSLFASISVFVVGGLLAALGVPEATRQLITDLPFVAPTSAALWQTKVLFMATLFVYAFFKFAWSLRQFNYTASMLGAAPPPEETASHSAYAEAIADLGSLAVKSYNGGMRAYYFGLAALTWFLHPIALVVAVLWVIAIVYRREFKSRTLAALQRTLSIDN